MRRIGIAAVLCAGLLVGAIDPRLKLPDAIYLLGLVVFGQAEQQAEFGRGQCQCAPRQCCLLPPRIQLKRTDGEDALGGCGVLSRRIRRLTAAEFLDGGPDHIEQRVLVARMSVKF